LLLVNPTLQFVIKKTKRSSSSVLKNIRYLIKNKFVKKLGYGIYQCVQKPIGSHPNGHIGDLHDALRLHNVEVKLLLSKDNFLKIKNTVLSDRIFFKTKDRKTGGSFFELDIKGYVGNDSVFIFFPADFEVDGLSVIDVMGQFDRLLLKLLDKWSGKFNVVLNKVGRVNYEIVNQHWSLVHNGIATELRKDNISNKVKVYDDEDGKVAYMFDQSKGFDELESPHPVKGSDYIEKARVFMDRVKKGEMEKLFDEHDDLKLLAKQQALIIQKLFSSDSGGEKDDDYVKDPKFFG